MTLGIAARVAKDVRGRVGWGEGGDEEWEKKFGKRLKGKTRDAVREVPPFSYALS